MIDRDVLLTWTTLSETNLGKFEVVKPDPYNSTEQVIQTIYTDGNSDTRKEYTVIDQDPLPGMNYYQLLSTDRDGKQERSQMIAINTRSSEQHARYYNGTVIFGQALKKGDAVTFYNCEGKEIRSFGITEARNYIELDLSPGISLIHITYRNGFSEVIRLPVN